MHLLKTSYGIIQKIRITWQLRKLEVAQTGIDEGVPFVELTNHLRFFGLQSGKKDRKYYGILPRNTQKMIPFECYKVATDIVIRYMEGGLKLGGPKKEHFYKVREGDVVAEMGAYMGYFTLYLAQKVGKNGRIIAIEPMKDNLRFLQKNIAFNGFDNVEIIDKGVWNKNETISFLRSPEDTQSASIGLKEGTKEEFTIEAKRLDSILEQCKAEHVNFMIIQLNGAEPEALEGLETFRPDHLAIAARYKVSDRNPVQHITNLLKAREYKILVRSRKYIYGDGTVKK